MGDFTETMKSIINQLKPKSKPELSDIEYESIIEHLSSKEHLLNELMNDMWYSGDLPSVRNHNELPSLIDSKLGLNEQICVWFALDHDLTPNQKNLNKKLLSALKCLASNCGSFDNTDPLEEFLYDNKSNKDLKVILNLKRGESESTVLHAIAGAKIGGFRRSGNQAIDLLLEAGADPNIQNSKGKTPLYLAAAKGHYDNANSLLLKGANPNIISKKGRTPQQIATNKLCYNIEELFLTDKQKKLNAELYDLLVRDSDCTKNLKEFLAKHKGDLDLKVVLNIRQGMGESKVFSHVERLYWDNEDFAQELRKIFLEAGALDYRININHSYQKKQQVSTLLVSLTSNQKEKLNKFSDKVFRAQNMAELEEIVNDAIKSGVRLNYSFSQDFFSGNEYTFTDYVMKKISELEKNPEVASSIICQLVSKGAVFGNTVDANTLTSEFKEHKTNMKKAYRDYISNVHKFIEVAKSATNSELKDARIDNSVFYLEYSKDSKIDITQIIDGARSLGLTHGDVKCGRNIVKIGNSEVEVKIENGIRNYTDLTEGSDIVLTFYTSLGNVDVRLYPDVQDKSKIIVEVSNREEILEKFKGREEELGNDCVLGDYWVYDAIEQGYFERSGGLMRPEVISESNNKKVSWTGREELRRDSMEEIARRHKLLQDLRNIESSIVKKEKSFDIKTHLIDIFKTLSRLSEEKENISKIDLVNAAERESKRLGLEGRYNWNGIFNLEKEDTEKAEKQGDKEQKSNVPNDFYLGHAINNGSCFFDSFRQSLEQQKGIKVTVEQLRNECKRFAQDNPPEWFISKIGNDFDEVEGEFVNRGITCNQYINSIGKNEFWGRSDIEGRVLCGKYGVKLHVAESNPLHTIDKQQDPFLHQLIDSSGSKAGKIDCNHNSVLHMVNGGHDHFQPLLYRNKVLAKQTQEQKDSLCYSSLPSCSMDELKIEKASHQHKALLVSRP
ncbi:MAG: ankyrin repeat domain-containing protein [Wolbachia sp.]